MIFWPFDLGKPSRERERTRAPCHIADALRVGVLTGDEGCELRVEAHLMACELCYEPSISVWERVRKRADPFRLGPRYSCLQARNALFRHIEGGRPLDDAVVTHLKECAGCADHFLEPVKARYALTVDEGAISALD